MENFVIVTDSNADLPEGFAKEHGVMELELSYNMDNKEYLCHDPAFSRQAFYARMRAGAMPKTAAVNVEQAERQFRALLENGSDILCIAFSSALSATCQSFQVAAEELRSVYPDRKIAVVDTLSASSGEALVVARAVGYQRAGDTLEEAAEKLREDSVHIIHLITVDDLFHLHRGGRMSKATAVVGSVLGIKPMLGVNKEGHLIPVGKVRGRKQALSALIDGMQAMYDPQKCDAFAISHGDCVDDAQFVANQIAARTGIKHYTITFIGPTIGAHSGPGTVALFFYGKQRQSAP